MKYQNQIPIYNNPCATSSRVPFSHTHRVKSFIFPLTHRAPVLHRNTPLVLRFRRKGEQKKKKRPRSLNVHPDLYTLFLPLLPPIIPLSLLPFPGSVNFAAVFFEAYRINCIVAPRWGLNFA